METITGPTEREFFKLRVMKRKACWVWVDAITGTMYDMKGTCLTSSTRRLVGLK